jgi:hypothetical protein
VDHWVRFLKWNCCRSLALKSRYKQSVIDGEAVILCVDGISDFSALHSGKNNDEV